MKTSSLLLAVILPVTAASAAPRKPSKPIVPASTEAANRCNVNLWPGFSATPCRPPPGITTYGECYKFVMDRGWTNSDAWWYCGSVQFKS